MIKVNSLGVVREACDETCLGGSRVSSERMMSELQLLDHWASTDGGR